jgi:hypothetical protein
MFILINKINHPITKTINLTCGVCGTHVELLNIINVKNLTIKYDYV